MTASTKDLIARLRSDDCANDDIDEAADALERLTQPVGVEPFTFYIDDIDDGEINREYNERNEFSCGRTGGLPLYPGETVSRLLELLDEQQQTIAALNMCIGGEGSTTTENLTRIARLQAERDALQRTLKDTLEFETAKAADCEQFKQERDALQEQVKMLRTALTYSWSGLYIDGIKAKRMAEEALAATEPKEKAE